MMPPRKPKALKLPPLLHDKLYKTGQRRGADDDEIYQNRVLRKNTVLIPYRYWDIASTPPPGENRFEGGFIALIPPQVYFESQAIHAELRNRGLALGTNALVFYEPRADWIKHNPATVGWQPAISRTAPLGGQYVARISANTSGDEGHKINAGFVTTSNKGAGIRVYEYASADTISLCRLQLEALFWLCSDSSEVANEQGMSAQESVQKREDNDRFCALYGLLDIARLTANRLLSKNGYTMCPLCLEELSAKGFFTKVEQAEGREVLELTITQLNLFHIEELRVGRYGHRPYNIGWGHHHCNVVVKDAGIDPTLIWMYDVVERNISEGYLTPKSD